MSDPERIEQAPEDLPGSPGTSISAKGRRSLSKSRRELTEGELDQSGVRLMLLDEVDRLDSEVTRLRSFEVRFHAADKQVGILVEKRRAEIAVEVLYSVCVGLGTGLLFYVPSLEDTLQVPAIATGAVLILGAVAAKVIRK